MTEPGPRILCIEDNPMNWRLVQRLLSQSGYEMHWAADGLRGCDLALELKPALILLDINLPGLSGFEVATKLRQNRELDATLIVALTAKTMRSDRETALVTGCDGFIPKPIDPFLFVAQVESYLGGQRDLLEQEREGAALRQFSRQVVERLELQLKEAQDGNRKLLAAQAELEQRSQNLSRLLSLSEEVIPVRNEREILVRVLAQLRQELDLDRLRAYRLHPSGVYFQGTALAGGGGEDTEVLPGTHPLVAWLEALPAGSVPAGGELQKSVTWQQGIELGLWAPRAQALVLPLRSRSAAGRLWGFLAGDRPDRPFEPFETELAALHAGMLQVSVENAALVAHLAETSEALGTSYEGLESTYEALKEARKALMAQNQRTALGGLFMGLAPRFQEPMAALREESAALSAILDGPDAPGRLQEGRRSLDRIRGAIDRVEELVQALWRRTVQKEASSPEWIQLHTLLRHELDLARAEGLVPESLPVEWDLQAPRDRLYGVYSDFTELLGHLLGHAMEGRPGRISLRTRGEGGHFQVELEDDGAPIESHLLEGAFEPFADLRPAATQPGRQPGRGLPVCAQLLSAYNGIVRMVPRDVGALVRIDLPLD
jgi:CheY-like chemotaxis protein/signal transduction histidine kinase